MRRPRVRSSCVKLPPASSFARERTDHHATEGVAAFAWNEVQPHARPALFGRHSGRLDRHLGEHRHVWHALSVRARLDCGDRHAIAQHFEVGRTTAVHGESAAAGRRAPGVAAHVHRAVVDARNHRGQERRIAVHRRVVDQFCREDAFAVGALHVDDRRSAGDGDGFLNRADAQFGVHGGDECAAQLNAFALDRAEPGEPERHGVDAGPEVLDAVLARLIRGDGPDFLNQRRARSFDADAREQRSRCVAGDAGNRRLRVHKRGDEDEPKGGARRRQSLHMTSGRHVGTGGRIIACVLDLHLHSLPGPGRRRSGLRGV